MNFQEMLKKQLESVEQEDFSDSTRPEDTLKHSRIYFNKDVSSVLVRILPPVTSDAMFAEGYRSTFLEATTDKGKKVTSNITLPLVPGQSNIEQALNTWEVNGVTPNRYGARPNTNFLVNAVQVNIDPSTGQFQYELDNQGQLVIRVLELRQTAFQALGAKLSDPMFGIPQPEGTPPEEAQYGFISATNAYPIQITKPKKGQMSYDVNVIQSIQLGALPQGWESLAEDLKYQVTPTEEHSPDFIRDFIDWVNNAGQQQGGFNQQQGGFNQQQGGFNQPPVQQQQGGFNQQQGGFNQPPVQQQQPPVQQQQGGFNQQQGGFNQPPVQQQQPPVQQQQPPVQQQQPPVQQQQPPVQQQQPPVQQQQPPVQQQQPPVQQQQPVNDVPPVQPPVDDVPAPPTGVTDVQALIDNMTQSGTI